MPHRGLFLFYIMQMVMVSDAKHVAHPVHRPRTSPPPKPPVLVTADYPKGCNGGPGPAKGGGDINLQEGACIYNMRGYGEFGLYQESTGIIIRTDMPGRYGDMRIKFSTFIVHQFAPHRLSTLSITGRANLDAEQDGVYLWWNPGGTDVYRGLGSRIDGIKVPSRVFVCFPGGERASNRGYDIEGWAFSEQLDLHFDNPVEGSTNKVKVNTEQAVTITKVELGWSHEIYFGARGQLDNGKHFQVARVVANGTLYG